MPLLLPRQLTWQAGKSPLFLNRRYIFIHGWLSIVMLVFRPCRPGNSPEKPRVLSKFNNGIQVPNPSKQNLNHGTNNANDSQLPVLVPPIPPGVAGKDLSTSFKSLANSG